MQTDEDQVDRDDEIQKPRHDQDEECPRSGPRLAEMWAAVMVIGMSPRLCSGKTRIEARILSSQSGSGIADAWRFNGFPARTKNAENCSEPMRAYSRNDAQRDELDRILAGGRRRVSRLRSSSCGTNYLAIAAIVGTISAPIAAQAQSGMTTGVVRGGVRRRRMSTASRSISVRRSANTSFASACRTTPFRIGSWSAACCRRSGVTYYDVPQTFGATPYRYTVVNGQTVLVEPRSRRIVQVVD